MDFIDPQTLTWFAIIALFISQIALFIVLRSFFQKTKKLFRGAKGKDVMQMLSDSMEKAEIVEKNMEKMQKQNKQDKEFFKYSLYKIGVIRFNPFKDMGGEQSFCIALLDGTDSGVLFTSLYAQDGTRTYAREIKNGSCDQKLSTEEEKALKQAMKID